MHVCVRHERQTMNNNNAIKWRNTHTHRRVVSRRLATKTQNSHDRKKARSHHENYLMGNNKQGARVCVRAVHTLRCLPAWHVFKTANKCRNGSDSSSSIIECLFDRERKRWYTGFYGLLITTLINFIDFWLETIFFYFPFFSLVICVVCAATSFFRPCGIAHTHSVIL